VKAAKFANLVKKATDAEKPLIPKIIHKVTKTVSDFPTLIFIPFIFLAYDYYNNRDMRATTKETIECFAWPAGIFVVKHFRPNPF
jgi:hypothetical protein